MKRTILKRNRPTSRRRTSLTAVEHVKSGRNDADIVYELLLKLGLDLCVPMETKEISREDTKNAKKKQAETFASFTASREPFKVYSIGGGVLLACLAEMITRDEVEPLGQGIVKWHKALAPAGDTTCVFRDSAFADDVAKTNLAAILNQNGIANVRSL